jgi:4-hydroxy 2-oxovalerate aldolase
MKTNSFKILDCTLRDGGYYTNWDFDNSLVKIYIESLNQLPVDYIEIGYRSKPLSGYYGEYFYCPSYVMEQLRMKSNKKLAIMLNEKDIVKENLNELLKPASGLIDMVRLAVDPNNFKRALDLAKIIKLDGFEIGFNVMYMSKWMDNKKFLDLINELDEVVDYFNMVDSYGGVYPHYIKEIFSLVRSKTNVKIGFHGHNNLELALINTLTAIECGADIVDCTMTGMGRGAGNLKTELLLTSLNAKGIFDFEFNSLSKVVDAFSNLHAEYGWGTNLPYMVSGANSLPQKEVMDWVGKRFYSFNSIIRALKNQAKGVKDNLELKIFLPDRRSTHVIIVGGGTFGASHSKAIKEYLAMNQEVVIIHSSSKNVEAYQNVANKQIHCLSGNEGYRLEAVYKNIISDNRMAVLPPYPRTMGTYVPSFFDSQAYELNEISFSDIYKDSVTAIAIQTALDSGANKIFFVGYDGYGGTISINQFELFNENEILFRKLKSHNVKFCSLTPTKYTELPLRSIYELL